MEAAARKPRREGETLRFSYLWVTLLVKTALPWLNDALNYQSGTVAGPSVASRGAGCQSHERAAAAVGAGGGVRAWSGYRYTGKKILR